VRFVLVDRILTLEPGHSVDAVKTLPAGEDVFEDHFPGFPVVPGVLLTEMMGQAAAKCLDSEVPSRGKAMLGKILQASFRGWVRPDQEILLHAQIVQNRPAFARAECSATVADKVVAKAELFFVFVPSQDFAPDYRDEVLEAFLESRAVQAGEAGRHG